MFYFFTWALVTQAFSPSLLIELDLYVFMCDKLPSVYNKVLYKQEEEGGGGEREEGEDRGRGKKGEGKK